MALPVSFFCIYKPAVRSVLTSESVAISRLCALMSQDVQFVAALGPPGGGRSSVTNRYLRHYSVVSITAFDSDNLGCVARVSALNIIYVIA